ncbi:hypothetical protein SAY86_014167 [Trapa natans]|uniref:Legume lectin domain-containing protein n=1 Tax=Trapa natans TaxID=22666 RepID=A0AAN7KS79_TRANT|nr:hypothetical protein SAY86_014167 [Trapa natans]
MAAIPLSRVSGLIFFLTILFSPPISSFALQALVNRSDFDDGNELLGDASVSSDGSSVQITRHSVPSSGIVIRSAPLRFSTPISFSTVFAFSISPGAGDGFALALFSKSSASSLGSTSFGLSKEDNKFVGVEFDTSMDENVGDLNANHVGIDLGSFVSVRVSNVSSMNLVLNSGEKLKSWVDYDASSKRLEVRLSRFAEPRPYIPIIAHMIDLSKIWKDEDDVLVGLCSSNVNTAQTSTIYSWRFRLRKVPTAMHSMPVDPNEIKRHKHEGENSKRGCPVALLGGLVLMALLGALLLSAVPNMWAMILEACRMDFPNTQVDFQYEKVGMAVENGGDCKK